MFKPSCKWACDVLWKDGIVTREYFTTREGVRNYKRVVQDHSAEAIHILHRQKTDSYFSIYSVWKKKGA